MVLIDRDREVARVVVGETVELAVEARVGLADVDAVGVVELRGVDAVERLALGLADREALGLEVLAVDRVERAIEVAERIAAEVEAVGQGGVDPADQRLAGLDRAEAVVGEIEVAERIDVAPPRIGGLHLDDRNPRDLGQLGRERLGDRVIGDQRERELDLARGGLRIAPDQELGEVSPNVGGRAHAIEPAEDLGLQLERDQVSGRAAEDRLEVADRVLEEVVLHQHPDLFELLVEVDLVVLAAALRALGDDLFGQRVAAGLDSLFGLARARARLRTDRRLHRGDRRLYRRRGRCRGLVVLVELLEFLDLLGVDLVEFLDVFVGPRGVVGLRGGVGLRGSVDEARGLELGHEPDDLAVLWRPAQGLARDHEGALPGFGAAVLLGPRELDDHADRLVGLAESDEGLGQQLEPDRIARHPLEQLVELHQRAPRLAELEVGADQLMQDVVDRAVVEQPLGHAHVLLRLAGLPEHARAGLEVLDRFVDSTLARVELGEAQPLGHVARHQVGDALVEHQRLAGVAAAQVHARDSLVERDGLGRAAQLFEGLGGAQVDVVALGREVENLAKHGQRLRDVAAVQVQIGRVNPALDRLVELAGAMQAVGQHQPALDVAGLVLDQRLVLADGLVELTPRDEALGGLQGLVTPKRQGASLLRASRASRTDQAWIRLQACSASLARMASGSRLRSRKWVS